MSKAKRLKPDFLVQEIRPNASERGETTHVVTGWLGESDRDGFWRLYATPELDDYIELSEADIVSAKEVPTNISPLGGSCIIVKETAQISGGTSESVSVSQALLQGSIAERFASNDEIDFPPDGSKLVPYNKNYTKGFVCTVSMFFMCTTHVVRNPTCTTASGKLCGTRRFLP